MAGIKRVPFRIGMIINCSDYIELQITKPEVENYHLEYRFPLGLPEDMVDFISTQGRCAFCKGEVQKDLSCCPNCCPTSRKLESIVEFPEELYQPVFRKLLEREESRLSNRWRRQRLAATEGSHTQEQLDKLLEIQQNLCYYCGTAFEPTAKGKGFHVDHYIALAEEGTDDIFNLVLACPSCNLKKGSQDGTSFVRIMGKQLSPEVKRLLGNIRRKRTRFLNSLDE